MNQLLQSAIWHKLVLYAKLVRLDKPIGSLLLLWPTLSALWLASAGKPSLQLILIFSIGTILMRSAGCAINDYADQEFDRHVKRTADRPLTSGKISGREALLIAALFALISFTLILPLNSLTKQLSLVAVLIAASYPYFKRFFALPQAYLGIAFGFGIPMAYAAVQNAIPYQAWLLLLANVFWALAYDTEYAMVDRDDDLRLGIKTSAITFGQYDVLSICICYSVCLLSFVVLGWLLVLPTIFWIFLGVAFLLAIYYFQLIKDRQKEKCFLAFKRNNWFGMSLFLAIAFAYH
jgi:4-hydroxybenzoate polyprenyltransferase